MYIRISQEIFKLVSYVIFNLEKNYVLDCMRLNLRAIILDSFVCHFKLVYSVVVIHNLGGESEILGGGSPPPQRL